MELPYEHYRFFHNSIVQPSISTENLLK
jgi:hypothetical protein